MDREEKIWLIVALLLVGSVFIYAFNHAFIRKPTYTIEVYRIFEVTHTENKNGKLTNVYTYEQGQFYFRGDHDIDQTKSYVFIYQENLKRWRDLTLLGFREFTPLDPKDREEECPTCP